MKTKIFGFLIGVVAALATGIIFYGCFWVAKNVSYSIFYQDMVKQTIHETIKNECILQEK
ncbi:MAG: hypothetical protein P8X74_03775 [Reinekea sp.]